MRGERPGKHLVTHTQDECALPARRRAELRTQVARHLDDLHDRGHRRLCLCVNFLFIDLGPRCAHNAAPLVRQLLPDFLGKERHKGMQEAHRALQHRTQDVERRVLCTHILLVIETCLRQLDVPVAELAPQELIDGASRLAKLVVLEVRRHRTCRLGRARENPAIGKRIVALLRHKRIVRTLKVHQHIARRIPNFICKIARRLDALPIEAHIVARCVAGDEHEAERVRTVLLDDLYGVDAVAERLRHLAPLAVAYKPVDEHITERHIAAEPQPHHDHTSHPEEDDVVARDERRRRVEMAEIFRILRPPQCLKRPKPRAEPRIEYVLILMDVRAAAVHARRNVFARNRGLTAVLTVPRRNAMPPPELARDAPVANIFEPVFVDFRKALGHETDAPVLHRCDCGLRQVLHADKPLLRYERLDRRLAARAVPDRMLMLLRAHECADLLKFLHELLAAFIAVKPRVLSCALTHRAVRIDDDHLFKIVAQPHLKVVRIVRRRHLDRARAECGIDVRICKERNAPLHHGQDQRLAHEIFVALIVGMHRHARIAEHRLGARRCNFNVVIHAINPIAEMPEMPLLRLMLDLDVGDRRRAVRTPIRDARALIDQPLLIEAHEHLAHRT